MAANGIRTHARNKPETFPGIEIAAILKRKMALDSSVTAALCWLKHVSI